MELQNKLPTCSVYTSLSLHTGCGSKAYIIQVVGLHESKSRHLTTSTVGAPTLLCKPSCTILHQMPPLWIYPKCIFRKGCLEHAARELFSSWPSMAVAHCWQIWGPLQPHAQANGHPNQMVGMDSFHSERLLAEVLFKTWSDSQSYG